MTIGDVNGARVQYTVTASDDCGPVELDCVPPSGSLFPPGISEVVCTARKAAGNETVCRFEVEVKIPEGEGLFRRADANGDGEADISDAINVLEYLFIGSASLSCLDAADSNDDGKVDISDPIGSPAGPVHRYPGRRGRSQSRS